MGEAFWRRKHSREIIGRCFGKPDIVRLIRGITIRWSGHGLRKTVKKITKIIDESLTEGIRPVRRPRARWKDQVHKYASDGTGRGGC